MSIHTRQARQVIEQVISGEDPFNLSKAAAAQYPVIILAEAWSPERQREISDQAQKMWYKMVDHLVIGDYDLTLWYTDKVKDNPNAYVVSINNAQHNPLSPDAQQTKQVGTAQTLPLPAIKEKVKSWVNEHGSILIGSVETDRNELYLRMFRRMFPGYEFTPYYGESFKYGFRLSNPRSVT